MYVSCMKYNPSSYTLALMFLHGLFDMVYSILYASIAVNAYNLELS